MLTPSIIDVLTMRNRYEHDGKMLSAKTVRGNRIVTLQETPSVTAEYTIGRRTITRKLYDTATQTPELVAVELAYR